jgi:hypothetical protein
MPRLRKTTLLRRSVLKAFRNPLNLAAGSAAVAATFLPDTLITPSSMPLAVWGVGAFGWVVFATVGQRYRPWVEEQERRRREARGEREALRYKTELLLNEPPFDLWTGAGYLPPYMTIFRSLKETRNRIAKILDARDDLDAFTKEDILQQLGYMLNAYLGFVRERVSYLQILGGTRFGVDAPGTPGWRKDFRRFSAKVAPVFVPPIPSLDKRLAEVDARIRQIRDLAAKEPATARTRQSPVGILEKQRELLLDCYSRDQCVVAQLGTFADAFEVIHGRLSASQFSAAEVSTYMSHLVEQIVETERFVETLRPSVDSVFGGLDPAMTAPIPKAARQAR